MDPGKPQFPRPFFGEGPRAEPKPTFSFDVQKELDQVVGDFREPGTPGQRAKRFVVKLLVGAVLAVAMAYAIVHVLDTHMTQAQKDAQKAPPPGKPVTVQILPQK